MQGAGNFTFKLALPAMLFYEVYRQDIHNTFDPELILFAVITIIIIAVAAGVLCFFIFPELKRASACAHTIFRTNFALLGLPLILSMFGDAGGAPGSLLLAVSIPTYNILAVTMLTVMNPDHTGKLNLDFKKILIGIITNPLIIAVVLGLAFSLLGIGLPTVLDKSVSYLAGASIPVALVVLGASTGARKLWSNIRFISIVTVIKLIAVPLVVMTAAVLLGFRGAELGSLFILFGTPTAVSSFVMAKNLGSDAELTGQILLMTTICATFTIFLGTFILKSMGLI